MGVWVHGKYQCIHTMRMVASRDRMLPDFIIVGAQKGGTSSLFSMLCRHPQILRPLKKEVHYFDYNYHRGEPWYKAHFPRVNYAIERGRELNCRVVTGEASPYYLFHNKAPERIAQTIKHVRLIVLLRDPVRRAYSHYMHEVRRGTESLSFEEAIAKEQIRIQSGAELRKGQSWDYNRSHQYYSYLARGLYLDQIRILQAYFDRSQICIVQSEELFRRPQSVYDKITDFIGLDRYRLVGKMAYNVGQYDKKQIPCEKELRDYFATPNQQLFRHLGYEFDW